MNLSLPRETGPHKRGILFPKSVAYARQQFINQRGIEIVGNPSEIDLTHCGIDVTVLEGPYIKKGKPTDTAIQYYSSIIENAEQLKAFAASKLLALYNESWRDDDSEEISASDFQEQISLSEVHLYDELGFAIAYFDDGDLFAGHSIEVSIEDGIPQEATIVG